MGFKKGFRSVTGTPQQSEQSLVTPNPSLVTIKHEKPHISGNLKFLATEEDRALALAGIETWKKRFAEEKWKDVLKSIETFANEDHLREPGRPRKQTLVRRNAVKKSAMDEGVWLRRRVKVPGIEDGGVPQPQLPLHPTLRTCPPTISTATTSGFSPYLSDVSTGPSRARWDVRSPGPATPLSPTPVGNSFADGGFWDDATLHSNAVSRPVSPATVILCNTSEPPSPYRPVEPSAKEIYDELKEEVHNAALANCATRIKKPSLLSSNALIHPSFINHSDELLAAESILAAKGTLLPSSISLPPPLPAINEKMASFSATESTILSDYSIRDSAALHNSSTWLQTNEKTGHLTTILDAQRNFLRENWAAQREDVFFGGVSEEQRGLAWATKLLCDVESSAERVPAGDKSRDEEGDDDGYSYANFLRCLRSAAAKGESQSQSQGQGESGGDLASAYLSSHYSPAFIPWSKITEEEEEEEEEKKEEEEEKEKETCGSNSGSETPRTTILFPEEDEAETWILDKRARRKAPCRGELESWADEVRSWEEEPREPDYPPPPPPSAKEEGGEEEEEEL